MRLCHLTGDTAGMARSVEPTGRRRPEFRALEERLWWARETAGFTQQQMADLLGISRKSVQNYEAGVGHPKENRLLLWANACDVDFEWLAGDFYAPGPERVRMAPTSQVSSASNRGLISSTRVLTREYVLSGNVAAA